MLKLLHMANGYILNKNDTNPYTFPVNRCTLQKKDLSQAPMVLVSSFVGAQLAKFGDFCLSGVDLCIATLIRSSRPLLSKEQRTAWEMEIPTEKAPSARLDLLQRILRATAAVLALVPCACIAVVLGIPCRLLSQPLQEDMVYLSPQSTLAQSTHPESITVMTQNMALSQFEIMNAMNEVPSTVCRREAWLQYFQSLEHKPEILCLQELFDPSSAHILGQALQQQGYYVVYAGKTAASGFGLSSGLFTASKFPIESARFENFAHRMGACRRANKGILGVTVRLREGNKGCLGILNTHLQAGLGRGAGTGARRKAFDNWVNHSQDDQITAFRKDFLSTHIEGQTAATGQQFDSLLVGDFNRGYIKENQHGALIKDPDYPLLQHLMDKGNWTHLGHHEADCEPANQNAVPQGSCFDRQSLGFLFPMNIAPKLHAKKLDFILYHTEDPTNSLIPHEVNRKEESRPPIGTHKGRRYVTSDHAAIISTCTLRQRLSVTSPYDNLVKNSQWHQSLDDAALDTKQPQESGWYANPHIIDCILRNTLRFTPPPEGSS